eukprot:246573-Pelagomonas_calceolata.AAC.2
MIDVFGGQSCPAVQLSIKKLIMAFVLHPPPRRRVKLGTETGMEYEERANPLDASYLQLLDENADARKAADASGDEAPCTPLDALEKFTMAL